MIIPYDTFPISESYLIKHSLHTFHTGRSVSKDQAIRFLDEDMTDLEMYVLFSPFGRIAPRGASARIDKDGTIQERPKNDLPGESTVRYSVLISPGSQWSQPEETGRNRKKQEESGSPRWSPHPPGPPGHRQMHRQGLPKVGENIDKR